MKFDLKNFQSFSPEIISHLITPVVVVDSELRIFMTNRPFAKLTGRNITRIKPGIHISEFYEITDLEKIIVQVKKNLNPWTQEVDGRGKGGIETRILLRIIPMKENLKLSGFVFSMMDTTLETKLHKDYKTLDLEKKIRIEAERRYILSNSLLPFKNPIEVLSKSCELLSSFYPDTCFFALVRKDKNTFIAASPLYKNREVMGEHINNIPPLENCPSLEENNVLKSYIKKHHGYDFHVSKMLKNRDDIPEASILIMGSEERRISELPAIDELILLVTSAHENAFLYRKVKEMSKRDGLTNLYNHRHFIEELDREIKRAIRYKYPVSLLFFDIDHFKIYNDLNGHQMGDRALVGLSRLLQSNCRDLDIITTWQTLPKGYGDDGVPEYFLSRYGGEEFAVILPHTEVTAASIAGERIRAKIEKRKFPGEERQPLGKLTVSMGISSASDRINTAEKLIKCADIALYESKSCGRNRVTVTNDKIVDQALRAIEIDPECNTNKAKEKHSAGMQDIYRPLIRSPLKLVAKVGEDSLYHTTDILKVVNPISHVVISSDGDFSNAIEMFTRIVNNQFISQLNIINNFSSSSLYELREKARGALSLKYEHRSNFLSETGLVLDELLMNAFYNAPVDDFGEKLHSRKPRNENLILDRGKNEITIFCSENFLAINCRDPFGSLVPGEIIPLMQSGKSRVVRNIPQTRKGAGIGLSLLFRYSDILIFKIQKNSFTDIYSVKFNKSLNYKLISILGQ